MSMRKEDITFKFLSECFELDAESGKIFWRVRPLHHFKREAAANFTNARCAGREAGCNERHVGGLVRKSIGVCGIYVQAHRVAYALHHGLDLIDVPVIVDHINCDTQDNRPSNLRAANFSQSVWNRRLFSTRGSSGIKGVYYMKKGDRWYSSVSAHGKKTHLGSFKTKEEAAQAYQDAAARLHGEFARF